MKLPFNYWEVKRAWLTGKYVVRVNHKDFEDNDDARQDWRADARRFIDDAIQEKVNRESIKNEFKSPIRGTAVATSPEVKSVACNYCQYPEDYSPGEVSRHVHTKITEPVETGMDGFGN